MGCHGTSRVRKSRATIIKRTAVQIKQILQAIEALLKLLAFEKIIF